MTSFPLPSVCTNVLNTSARHAALTIAISLYDLPDWSLIYPPDQRLLFFHFSLCAQHTHQKPRAAKAVFLFADWSERLNTTNHDAFTLRPACKADYHGTASSLSRNLSFVKLVLNRTIHSMVCPCTGADIQRLDHCLFLLCFVCSFVYQTKA